MTLQDPYRRHVEPMFGASGRDPNAEIITVHANADRESLTVVNVPPVKPGKRVQVELIVEGTLQEGSIS